MTLLVVATKRGIDLRNPDGNLLHIRIEECPDEGRIITLDLFADFAADPETEDWLEGERFPATPDGARAATAWARGEGFNVLLTLRGVCA